jgi:hypothetical protein
MKNNIIKYATICSICFGIGFVTAWKALEHEKIVIVKEEINAPNIKKDLSKMTVDEKNTDLTHFYTDKPELDIKNIGGDDYLLTSGLYLRKWDRKVTIKIERPKNLVIINGIIDSKLNYGGMAQYYRMIGRYGLGGCVGIIQSQAFVGLGVAFQW